MGCHQYCDCGSKFVGEDADEYAHEIGLDEPDYDRWPDCFDRKRQEAEQEEHIESISMMCYHLKGILI